MPFRFMKGFIGTLYFRIVGGPVRPNPHLKPTQSLALPWAPGDPCPFPGQHPLSPQPTWARSSSWFVFTPKRGMLESVRLLLCISFFTPVICDMGWNCGPGGSGCWEGLCRGACCSSPSFIVGDGISTSFCLSVDDEGAASMSLPQSLPIWPLDTILFTWEVSSRRADPLLGVMLLVTHRLETRGKEGILMGGGRLELEPRGLLEAVEWHGSNCQVSHGRVVWEINKWGGDARESHCLTQIGRETSLDWKTPAW